MNEAAINALFRLLTPTPSVSEPAPVAKVALIELNATLGELSAAEVITACVRYFGTSLAFANSFGLEDLVIQHLLLTASPGTPRPTSFVLDTGRLPSETYAVIEAWRERFGVSFAMFNPRAETLAAFTGAHGPNAFYASIAKRQQCCAIRKLEPLARALDGKQAWLTGLRRGQSPSRATAALAAYDEAGRLKISPLVDWELAEVWAYVRQHDLPYNALHDRGFPSIGCAPCTRAVAPGEDLRAGRWWWEEDAKKECGLHDHKRTKEVADHVR